MQNITLLFSEDQSKYKKIDPPKKPADINIGVLLQNDKKHVFSFIENENPIHLNSFNKQTSNIYKVNK